MKLLVEISDASLGLSVFEPLGKNYELRKSARAILKKPDGTIAIQHLKNHHLHKLPGGGVEASETLQGALLREIKEEVGCHAAITGEVGVVIEYRKEQKLLHISYCYVADIVGAIEEPALELAEIAEGMSTVWMTPEEAVAQMNADMPNTYQGPFITKRELAFLDEYMGSGSN
jgi:ADP-ribose pyrophosphatase YjhB (NUDIX family)